MYVKLFTEAIIIRKKMVYRNLYFVLKIEQKLRVSFSTLPISVNKNQEKQN